MNIQEQANYLVDHEGGPDAMWNALEANRLGLERLCRERHEGNERLREKLKECKNTVRVVENLNSQYVDDKNQIYTQLEDMRAKLARRDEDVAKAYERIAEADATIDGLENQITGLSDQLARKDVSLYQAWSELSEYKEKEEEKLSAKETS